ncbi:cupin domain-containing protein [Anaeromyxobacter oryzae]|nr:cupin domain-containing protein [Anaeromyxobacter oryzae]
MALCAVGLATSASAGTTTVLKTSRTWNGSQIKYFETKCPEVDAVIVDIPANASTQLHLHPVNNYAYILEGQVTVQEGELVHGRLVVRKSSTFTKGQAFAELVNTWHVGKAGPEGVKILVWYTTEVGYPYTVTDLSYQVDANLEGSSHCLPPKS